MHTESDHDEGFLTALVAAALQCERSELSANDDSWQQIQTSSTPLERSSKENGLASEGEAE
jgi:hypothetical protein